MKKSTAVFRGLAGVFAFLLPLSATATNLTFQYSGIINTRMGIDTTETVSGDSSDGTIYYANDYGYDESALPEVYADTKEVNIEIAEEGTVLLKNEDSALPLSDGARMTIFGYEAVNTTIWSDSSPDYMEATSFLDAMKAEFGEDNINTEVCDNAYATGESEGFQQNQAGSAGEVDLDEITAYEDSWQSDYNDAAILVLARKGSEGNDLSMYSETDTYDDGSARRYMDLSTNEEALVEYLEEQKAEGVFDKIIVVVATEWQMELDWLYEYDIDAAVLSGLNGSWGCTGLAEVLSGTVNPSGKLVDTYASNSLSAPATTYAAENSYEWINADEVIDANTLVNAADGANIKYYIIYAEGIYVGYKYYETRYEDSVMGAGNADSETGSSSDGGWNYADEMVYTFGYGLSYTDFEQTLDSVTYDEESGYYTATVTVTNTGDTAGKDVVEVYAQTPYGDYEKENLVEKASIQLVAYDKTDLLEPGESQTLEIPVWEYYLASYDTNGYGTYILSEGDYYLSIGSDAHDALNNILTAKGYSTADGMTADGNADKTYTWTQEEIDAETYSTSVYTDATVENQFDDSDLNYYGYDFTYLSRSDWEGTYPAEPEQLEATDEIIDSLSNYDYETPEDAPSVDDFTQNADNGLTLADMMEVDYDDEETWNEFLDQFTIEELCNFMTDSLSVTAVTRLGVTGAQRVDDDTTTGGQMKWVSHPTLARTWNTELYEKRGTYSGLVAQLNGYDELWYGLGNLHRTPFGGRANQYYSEDSTMSYTVGYVEAAALQATGVTCCAKHFCTNDQETHRQGISTFVTEQALREIYARSFEGAFAGGALSTMTALNRIGTRLAKNNTALITNLLRDEWGFEGHVTSDGYVQSGYFDNTLEELVAGMDYSCCDSIGLNAQRMLSAINDGDGYILEKTRELAKHNLYVMTKSWRMNGMGEGTNVLHIVPVWQTLLLLLNAVSLIGLAVFTVLAVVSGRKKKKDTVVVKKEKEV